MMNKKISILIVLLTIFFTSFIYAEDTPSSGRFVVFFDVSGRPSEAQETLPATVSGYGVRGHLLKRGAGIKPYNLANGFSAHEWVLDDISLKGAIDAEKYFEFSFSVESGFTASLETLDLSLRRSAKNGPMNYELQVSLDGFATPGITLSSFNYYGRVSGSEPKSSPIKTDRYYYMHSDLAGRGNTTGSPGDPIPTVDLTNFAELQKIPSGTDVTFRLYAWGNESTSPTNTVALGRIQGPLITGRFVSD